MNWHSVDTKQLCKTYATGERSGLVEYRCTLLRQKYGENVLTAPSDASFINSTVQELKSPPGINSLLVLITVLVLACMGRLHWVWALCAGAIALASVALRAFLSFRADRPLKRFDALSVPTAEVIRGGMTQRLPASQLVPGDLILLNVGDRIPADARLLESDGLRCDESVLTGRMQPQLKRADVLLETDTPAADRINMVYMGCDVISGYGRAVVTATGIRTEFGRLLTSMAEKRQKRAAPNGLFYHLGIVLLSAAALFVAVTAVYAPVTHTPFSQLADILGAMPVAAALIPLTAAQAAVVRMGERRLALRGAAIKRTGTLETLGNVSLICTEKDGVFTQNHLTVEALWSHGALTPFSARLTDNALALLKLCALCNNAVISFEDGEERRQGSPAETAVLDAAMRNGMSRKLLGKEYPRLGEIPFTTERMRMTTVNDIEGEPVVIVKGGFDILLPMCAHGSLDTAQKAHAELCGRFPHVIAVAYKQLDAIPDALNPAELECGLTLAGLIGLSDPFRPDAEKAVHVCRAEGIRTILMTNDHISTACTAARSLGILTDDNQAISGDDLTLFSDKELAAVIESLTVYARIGDHDKARVINAWKRKGHTVLVVGSGMRELPAIGAADIGCCMRECAGEGLKSVCDLLVTDNRFTTVLEAIRESRFVKENLHQAARYLLSSCFASLFTAAAALIPGISSLISVPQILFINLFPSLLFSIALGCEPTQDRKRTPDGASDLTPAAYLFAALKGLLCALFAVGAYFVGAKLFITDLMEPSHAVGGAMAFFVLLLCQCALAAACRSRTASSLSLGFFSSPFYNVALLLTILAWIMCALVPALGLWLAFTPISVIHSAAALIISIVFALILTLCRIPALMRDAAVDRFG